MRKTLYRYYYGGDIAILIKLPHYRFDSSHDRGQPLSTPIGVGRLIKGAYPGSLSHEPAAWTANLEYEVSDIVLSHRLGRGRSPDELGRKGHSDHQSVSRMPHWTLQQSSYLHFISFLVTMATVRGRSKSFAVSSLPPPLPLIPLATSKLQQK